MGEASFVLSTGEREAHGCVFKCAAWSVEEHLNEVIVGYGVIAMLFEWVTVAFVADNDIADAISTASRQEREPVLLWNSEFSRQGASSLPSGSRPSKYG